MSNGIKFIVFLDTLAFKNLGSVRFLLMFLTYQVYYVYQGSFYLIKIL